MRIPQFWAEGRAHQPRVGRDGKQVTVRRWGWSDESQEDAQRHADERAQESLARILAGENRRRREPKVPYNGAEGVPIREEIVSRHGETIITRNSYGAFCLNTSNVLFADVDFGAEISGWAVFNCATAGGAALAIPSIWLAHDIWVAAFAIGAILGGLVPLAWSALSRWLRGGPEQISRRKLLGFLSDNPEWNVRLYQTPAGLRLLATHKLYDPASPETLRFFQAIGSDPIYVTMCRRQACFRARVSPKPWRIGIEQHIRPRTAVWPLPPEKLPRRAAWIREYEEACESFASCRYLETIGSGVTDPEVLEVQRLHDEMCRADSDLPIA